MDRNTLKHVGEERLEAYAMGTLAEDEVAVVEEHLLFCATCQDRLEELDGYTQAMRGAAKRIREEEVVAPATPGAWGRVREWFHTPAPIWAGALAMLAVILMIGLRLQVQPPGSPVEVELHAIRGASAGTALAGHALRLRLDNRGVAEDAAWRVEIVDEEGTRVWIGTGSWTDSAVLASVDRSFTAGTYFVRLLKEGEDPVREYHLVVQKP